MSALAEQLEYLEATSPFYRARIRGARELAAIPFTTKQELRESQQRHPPFGEHLCAPREDLVRLHVTSGTTGEPVAIGLTQADHEANSSVGGEAFRIAGLRPDDTVAHCLNYALYAGGIADHMAIEASGATVVPVGVGQSRRLLELIPRLGITAIFGTLSFPAYLATRAREAGLDPAALGLRHIVTAGEPGAGLAAVRAEIEQAWGVSVADSFGMSDMWSTMAGECGQGEGLHLTTEGHAVLEVVDPETGETLPLEDGVERRARVDPPRPPGLAAAALPLERPRHGLHRAVRVRAHEPAHPHRRPPRRHAARAGGQRLPAGDRRGARPPRRRAPATRSSPTATRSRSPLHIYVESPEDLDRLASELRAALRTDVALTALAPGDLPVAEHKTARVFRTARGDALPDAIRRHREDPQP